MIEIYHISDLHFGKVEFWRDHNDRVEKFLAAIHSQFGFAGSNEKYLLMTGDTTNSGAEEEYDLALKSLNRFFRIGQVLVCPGNHDYGACFGNCYDKKSVENFDDFAKLLGMGHAYHGNTKVFNLLLKGSDGNDIRLYGLNSCTKEGISDWSRGRIGYRQLNDLDKTLGGYESTVKKIVFLHHIPNKHADWKDIMTLEDWEDLMGIIEEHKCVYAMAFGHQGYISKDDEILHQINLLGPKVRSMIPREHVYNTGKNIFLLDADDCLEDWKCYRITSDEIPPTDVPLRNT